MQTSNPLLSDWKDRFQLPPFDLIKDHHFNEAFDEAFLQLEKAINKISEQSDAPSFSNTIEALERSDRLMGESCWCFCKSSELKFKPSTRGLATRIST